MKKKAKVEKMKRICVDTSAIINGKVTELVKKGKLKNVEIIIPQLVMGELQAQASRGREIGYIGLEEIQNDEIDNLHIHTNHHTNEQFYFPVSQMMVSLSTDFSTKN